MPVYTYTYMFMHIHISIYVYIHLWSSGHGEPFASMPVYASVCVACRVQLARAGVWSHACIMYGASLCAWLKATRATSSYSSCFKGAPTLPKRDSIGRISQFFSPIFLQFFPDFHPKLPPESFRTLRIRCSTLIRCSGSYSRPNPWELDPVLSQKSPL